MVHYDVVIIGVGIAGLFLADQLLRIHPSWRIVLLDKRTKPGGYRYLHDTVYTAHYHPLLTNLVKTLNIPPRPVPPIQYQIQYGEEYTVTPPASLDLDPDTTPLSLGSNNIHSQGGSLFTQWKAALPPKALRFCTLAAPRWAEIHLAHPMDALRSLHAALEHHKGRRYHLTDNIDRLIQLLETRIRRRGGTLLYKTKATGFCERDGGFDVFAKASSDVLFHTKQLVLALPPHDLVALNAPLYIQHLSPILQTFQTSPICKVMCRFPQRVWFRGLGPVCMGGPLRHMLPVSEKQGMILVSQTTGPDTIPIYEAHLEGKLERFIHWHLQRSFPKRRVPMPLETRVHYSDRVHHVSPTPIHEAVSQIRQPFPNMSLYVIGNSYSSDPSHMEGSLESAMDLVVLMETPRPSLENMVDTQPDTSHESSTPIVDDLSVPLIPLTIPPELPLFSKKSVLAHRHWVVLFDYVYDVGPAFRKSLLSASKILQKQLHLRKPGKQMEKRWKQHYWTPYWKRLLCTMNRKRISSFHVAWTERLVGHWNPLDKPRQQVALPEKMVLMTVEKQHSIEKHVEDSDDTPVVLGRNDSQPPPQTVDPVSDHTLEDATPPVVSEDCCSQDAPCLDSGDKT